MGARDIDVPKIDLGVVADTIIAGVERDREEIRVGRVRQLAPLARVLPTLGDRIVTRAVTPSD